MLRLARKLVALGHQCEVLNLNPDIENSALVESYSDLTIRRVSLPTLWLRRLDRRVRGFSLRAWLTRRWIERHCLGRYDIYHAHLFKTDLLMSEVKRRSPDVRFVSTLHGDYQLFHEQAGEGGERIAGWTGKMRLVRAQCDAWAYIADRQAELLTESYGVPAAKLHKIYNGYEPPVLAPAAPRRAGGGGLTFIMVARGIREKGWDFLLRAFRRLEPGSHLILVGEGPHLDELRAEYAHDPAIRFTGFHPNPIELIQSADVFVFPSLYGAESLPTVLMEALYCGVPVISTAIGEIPRMLATPSGELAGQLIDASPDVTESLVQAMSLYVHDRDLLDRHRRCTAAAFAQFDMAGCAEKYLDLYGSVLAGRLPTA